MQLEGLWIEIFQMLLTNAFLESLFLDERNDNDDHHSSNKRREFLPVENRFGSGRFIGHTDETIASILSMIPSILTLKQLSIELCSFPRKSTKGLIDAFRANFTMQEVVIYPSKIVLNESEEVVLKSCGLRNRTLSLGGKGEYRLDTVTAVPIALWSHILAAIYRHGLTHGNWKSSAYECLPLIWEAIEEPRRKHVTMEGGYSCYAGNSPCTKKLRAA